MRAELSLRLLARAWLAAVVLTLPLQVARASPNDPLDPAGAARERARRTFEEAQATFAAGNFAAAGAAFEEAARLAPHPATWLNAAEAWEQAGELVRAAEDCDVAVETAAGDPRFVDDIARRLRRIESRIARVVIPTRPSRSARIDAGPLRPLPVIQRVAAGRHVILVREDGLDGGREERRDVTLAPGSTWTWEEARAIAAPAPVARASSRPVPTSSIVLFAIAGAAAVAGGVFGAMTLSGKSDFERTPTFEGRDRFYRDRAVTNVLLAGSVACLAAGVVAWLVTPRRPTPGAARVSGDLLAF